MLYNNIPQLIDKYLQSIGIGYIPGKYMILLHDDACPIIPTPWKYLVKLRPLGKKELDKMVVLAIVAKVESHQTGCHYFSVPGRQVATFSMSGSKAPECSDPLRPPQNANSRRGHVEIC